GVGLALVLFDDGLLELGLVRVGKRLAAALGLFALDLYQHAGGLLGAHYADPRIRPHPQEAWVVGTAAHAVITGAEAAADDHGELRYLGAGHRGDQLGAMLGDAAGLVFLPDHEAGDVLQKQQRNAALAGQFDEVRAFLRRFGEEDAVVRQDRHRIAVDMGETANQRGAEQRLEFIEAGVVDDTGDHLAHVERLLAVGRNHPVQLFGGIARRQWLLALQLAELAPVEVG